MAASKMKRFISPTELVLTIVIDLGGYEFKHIRLKTKFDDIRLTQLESEAMRYVSGLDNVIWFEIAKAYRGSSPRTHKIADTWELSLDEFLQRHEHWQEDALWVEGVR